MRSTPRPLLGATVAVLLLTLTACQDSRTATSVASAPQLDAETGATIGLTPIPDAVWDADLHPGQGLIGLNQVTLDVANLQATLEPVRMAAAIGDSFDVDMYDYLKSSPCSDCLRVDGLRMVGSNIEVTFNAKHPFAFGPKRYDLHLFDTRGTLIPITGTGKPSGIVSQIGAAALETTGPFGMLANADGYSSFFTEQVAPYVGTLASAAAGRIFPFKTMFRDLSPSNYVPAAGTFTDLQFPQGHNTLAMGEGFATGATAFELDVAGLGNQVQFLFLVDSAYGASSTRPTRLTPRYFLPEFHRKEPFEVTMSIIGGHLIAGSTSSFSQAQVTARDWQGEQPANPAFGPTSPSDTLKHRSGVNAMSFFIPGVMLGAPLTKTVGVDFNGVVNPGEYWTTYDAIFSYTNAAAAPIGTYYAVVAVRDELYNSGDALAVTRQFTSGQPPQAQIDLSTYAIAQVTVEADPFTTPTFDLIRNPLPADPVHHGTLLTFLIDNIATPGSSIASVVADPNYDGIPANFAGSLICNMLDSNTYQVDYDYRNGGFLPTPGTPLTFAVRVRDLENDESIETATVQLAANLLPTASWNGTVPTTGTQGSPVNILASHVVANDADGTLGDYRISWGDATADYLGPLPAAHTYTSAAVFNMTIYVRDNGYGPAGPAPAPGITESAGASQSITISPPVGPSVFWGEDFEAVSVNGLPASWALSTGMSGGSRFGVKKDATLTAGSPLAGQTAVLEESGAVGAGNVDTNYAINLGTDANRSRWGVFSPMISIPSDANNYTLELVHRRAYTTLTDNGTFFTGYRTADGCNMFIKSAPGLTDPLASETGGGTMTAPAWSAFGPATTITAPFTPPFPGFCNYIAATGNPMSAAPVMPNTALCWGNSTSGETNLWETSTLDLLPYKGSTIRLYFAHGQTKWLFGGGLCTGPFWNWGVVSSEISYGWKIDQVRITSS